MSPKTGRPTDNPKTERLEIRLTKQQAQDIEDVVTDYVEED